MKLSYLVKGFPGHPLHPPLTDATIGIYTVATAFAVLSKLGVSEENLGTPLWRTATLHLTSMVTATVFFLLAAIVGHGDYVDRSVGGAGLVLTLIGFAFLTLGGWLGGAIVFTHGMRVLKLVDEPTRRAVVPGHPEKEQAEA